MIGSLFRRHPIAAQLLFALVAAFATRAWQFGNPVIQIDEQFYLLAGDRMWAGAVPFVDIWDRKPVGTFLVYAAVRLLGGDGIVQYQLVATLFAAATAFLIAQMACRFASGIGAACAGAAYLLWLLIFDGSGGQTPVFYNAFMAAAAALTLGAITDTRRLFAWGAAAMLLTGIAMQIKYSALFEGVFFGLALLWAGWRQRGWRFAAASALPWIALALLPTIAAYTWYARHGQTEAFVYANFLSILDRGHWPAGKLAGRLASIAGLSLPLLICAWTEWRCDAPDGQAAAARRFALGWLAAALIGLLIFGTYFTHYFLPVLVPLALVCARLLGDREAGVAVVAQGRTRRIGFAAFLAVTALALIALTCPKRLRNRGEGEGVRAVAQVIRANSRGCLLVFDGEPILYHLTRACMATTRVFPNHLNDQTEARAVGIDPAVELRRILNARTADIIVGSDRPDPRYNRETLAILNAALARDYRPIYRRRIGSRVRIVYQRRAER